MKCSNCNSIVGVNDKFCGSCGAKVEPVNKCNTCGKINEIGAKFCGGCGNNLQSSSSSNYSQPTYQSTISSSTVSQKVNESKPTINTYNPTENVSEGATGKKVVVWILSVVLYLFIYCVHVIIIGGIFAEILGYNPIGFDPRPPFLVIDIIIFLPVWTSYKITKWLKNNILSN